MEPIEYRSRNDDDRPKAGLPAIVGGLLPVLAVLLILVVAGLLQIGLVNPGMHASEWVYRRACILGLALVAGGWIGSIWRCAS
jgi:hypothetical protein